MPSKGNKHRMTVKHAERNREHYLTHKEGYTTLEALEDMKARLGKGKKRTKKGQV
jgi:hypothetical protein